MRVANRRRDRPEIEELTQQTWVPVLIHGDEVISDSHRILEYLDWVDEQSRARQQARLAPDARPLLQECLRLPARRPAAAHGRIVLMAWERWQSPLRGGEGAYKQRARELAAKGRELALEARAQVEQQTGGKKRRRS